VEQSVDAKVIAQIEAIEGILAVRVL